MDTLEQHKKNISDRINNIIVEEKNRQAMEMVVEGRIKFTNSLEPRIKFDQCKIDIVYAVEVDNICKELSLLLLREEISEDFYDELISDL